MNKADLSYLLLKVIHQYRSTQSSLKISDPNIIEALDLMINMVKNETI